MAGPRSLRGGVLLAASLMLGGPAIAGEPALVASPAQPGPQHPPAGQSLFDELFATPQGYDIPFPFARLIEHLDGYLAPERVRTALIPLGRSLQRYSADPDYFASPRLVVAVTADAADSPAPLAAPRLRDRLYIGYQPAAEVLEVISYNEAAGRFEFQEVVDYGPDRAPQAGYAAREICVACHQAHAPIFSRPLWSESNGNPQVADRLMELGPTYHGAPVLQGIDALDDFDQSTDRANRIAIVNRIWDEGCGSGPSGIECRRAVLAAAFAYRLAGARADWRPPLAHAVAGRLAARMTELWPHGIAAPDPDLANADPVRELAAGRALADILEPSGPRNPETPRRALTYWAPMTDAAANLAGIARDVGAQFATSDIVWLDSHLAAHRAPGSSHRTTCRTQSVQREDGRVELRLDCGGEGSTLTLSGFVVSNGDEVTGGRIDALSLNGDAAVRRLRVVGGAATAQSVAIDLRDASADLHPRLLSGERIAGVRLGADGVIEVRIVDDLDALDSALDLLARDDDGALGPGPLRRRAVLAGIARAFEGS